MRTLAVFVALAVSSEMFAQEQAETSFDGRYFSDFITFGTSDSDVGNVKAQFRVVPPSPPYYQGQYTNGNNWNTIVGEFIGHQSKAFRSGGHNVAHGGALTGDGDSVFGAGLWNAGEQISQYHDRHGEISSTALVAFFFGTNDSKVDSETSLFIGNVEDHLSRLHDIGARRFLIGNVNPRESRGAEYNVALAELVDELALQWSDTGFAWVDIAGAVEATLADPESHGFLNVEDPACRDCHFGEVWNASDIQQPVDSFLYLDDANHYTSAQHQFIAERTFAGVSSLAFSIGDYDGDGEFAGADFDLLSALVRDNPRRPKSWFDLNGDGSLTVEDQNIWVWDIAQTIPGDANFDGDVAFDDFLALASNFNGAGGWSEGDFNGSGEIDFSDFLKLSSNYGQSSVSSNPVPEPTALQLLVFIAIILPRWRRLL